MRAIVSGQAGLAVLMDGDATSVVRIERPEEVLPCRPSDIFWFFADAVDVEEFEEITSIGAIEELKKSWRGDRGLQLTLILLDSKERIETRRRAAEQLENSLGEMKVREFVANRLYATSLPAIADLQGAKEQTDGGERKLVELLEELEIHQDAIRRTREGWDTLRLELFGGIKEKQEFEKAAVSAGIFRFFSQSVQKGTQIARGTVLANCLADPRFRKYKAGLETIVTAWVETVASDQRAMVAVQLLTVSQLLRLKRYAEGLITGLGQRVPGRQYRDLLRDAVAVIIAERGIWKGGAEFPQHLQTAMRSIARRWWSYNERNVFSSQVIWDAVLSLPRKDLRRLNSYARWRTRLVARKARGRDEKDLLGEAVTATVSGKRVWRKEIGLCSHLLGAMRSISSSWCETEGEEYLESELVRPENETSPLDQAVTSIDPERILRAKERLEQIRRLFAKDEPASQVIELIALGHTAKEIQSLLGMSERVFGAVVKRIKRKLVMRFPDKHKTKTRLPSKSAVGAGADPQSHEIYHEVYRESEQYKSGWVHGFYDCVSDDGALYGGESRFSQLNGIDRARAEHDYQCGYKDGMVDRLGVPMNERPSCHRTSGKMKRRAATPHAA